MKYSLWLTSMLPYLEGSLYSGYDIHHWKPDPQLMYHTADRMQVPIEKCILVDDSEAGARAGIAAGIPVFYYCADAHNPAIDHPLVARFDDTAQRSCQHCGAPVGGIWYQPSRHSCRPYRILHRAM